MSSDPFSDLLALADARSVVAGGFTAGGRWARLAQRALRADEPVSVLAHELGYASESAFSNAFKRVTGMAPMHYPNAQRETARSAIPTLNHPSEDMGLL